MGGWSLFENCTVDASICGEVFKGARWMPWHQEPMKDVGGHDRPRGVVNQALIRCCSNWEIRHASLAVSLVTTHIASRVNARQSYISIPAGRKTNRDSCRSGEPNRMRPNRSRVSPGRGCA